MTLLSALIDAVEADLQDSGNATYAAADIERWLRDAIDDYSQFFPRSAVDTITTSADDRQYDLNADFIETLSVEYPTAEDPPQYLKRRPYTHPDFWQEDGYYDIIYNRDTGNVDEILISTKPPANETITIVYQAKHDSTILTSATPTVPEEHHHILRAYARWKAVEFLAAAEEAAPTSNSSILMSQLVSNASRYRRAYIDALAKLIQSDYGRSTVVSWANTSKENTRIY